LGIDALRLPYQNGKDESEENPDERFHLTTEPAQSHFEGALAAGCFMLFPCPKNPEYFGTTGRSDSEWSHDHQ
jgi:hypothetical protein